MSMILNASVTTGRLMYNEHYPNYPWNPV